MHVFFYICLVIDPWAQGLRMHSAHSAQTPLPTLYKYFNNYREIFKKNKGESDRRHAVLTSGFCKQIYAHQWAHIHHKTKHPNTDIKICKDKWLT